MVVRLLIKFCIAVGLGISMAMLSVFSCVISRDTLTLVGMLSTALILILLIEWVSK